MLVSLLLALVSFLGGPLYVCDRLGQTALAPRLAFALGAGPLLLWLVGLIALPDEDDVVTRVSTRLGIAGALALIAENLLALDGIVRLRDAQHPGLHGLGIAVGLLAAIPYLRGARRKLRGEPTGLERLIFHLPTWLADVFALIVCSAGTLAGLVLIRRDPERALAVTILFGGMAAFMAWHITRRRRLLRDDRPPALEVVRGVTLRPSRQKTALGFGLLTLYGAGIGWFGRGFPLPFVAIAVFLTLVGSAGLVLTSLRKIPPGFVRIETDRLIVGMRRYVLEVPWGAIDAVSLVEFHGTVMVAIFVADLARISVEPRAEAARAHEALASSEALTGVPLLISTVAYLVEPRALVEAIAEQLSRADAPSAADERDVPSPDVR